MNSGLFLRFLKEEYLNLIERQRTKRPLFKSRSARVEPLPCSIPRDQAEKFDRIGNEICNFKKFIIEMIRTERIQLFDGTEIPAQEYMIHMALEKSRVPPYKPLYPYLISILNLFDEKEIVEYFGSGYLHIFRKMLTISSSI